MIKSAELIVAVDIDAGWWTYRVHLDGTVYGQCPEESEWCQVLKNDLDDDEEVKFSDLIAAADEEFKKAGLK